MPQTVFEIMKTNAARYPIRKAFCVFGENGEPAYINYKRTFEDVKRFAAGLLSENCGKTAIAVIGENSYPWCVAYLAAMTCAGTAVPLETGLNAGELLDLILFSEAGCAVADEEQIEKLLAVSDRLPKGFLLISTSHNTSGGVKSFEAVMQKGAEALKEDPEAVEKNLNYPDEQAVVVFTSGTTGAPKGVVLTNSNITSDIEGISRRIKIAISDKTLCTLPMFHTYQCIVVLCLLASGGTVSFSRGYRYYEKDMQRFRPTVIATVPLVIEKLHRSIMRKLVSQGKIRRSLTVGKLGSVLKRANDEKLKHIIYSHIHQSFGGELRYFIVGGAPVNAKVLRDFKSFGFPVVTGYGLTECAPVVACSTADNPDTGSVGRPLDGIEVKIDRPDEKGIGEILVKGPVVTPGYLKRDDLTEKCITDGWFHTGDLGKLDGKGKLRITGRIKNVIVLKNGKNVSPEEIEELLLESPLVSEAVVSLNENGDLHALLVLEKECTEYAESGDDGAFESISGFVRELNKKLPRYKRIYTFEVSDASPEKTILQKSKRL